MADLLLSDLAIIIYEALIIIVMLVFGIKLAKEKRNAYKNAGIQQQRQREQELVQKLANNKGSRQ